MIMAITLHEKSDEAQGGILVVGLEAVDVAQVLAADLGEAAFHIPLKDVGSPYLKEWAIEILGPLSTARFQTLQGGGQNGGIVE